MYVVTKTIKGRHYRYLQRSWRKGKRVHTKSICLGPVDGAGGAVAPQRQRRGILAFLDAQRLSPEDRAMATAERLATKVAEYQRERFGETAVERAGRERIEHLAQLYSAYGLTVSDPKLADVVKAAADQSALCTEAKESPSANEGQESSTEAAADAQKS